MSGLASVVDLSAAAKAIPDKKGASAKKTYAQRKRLRQLITEMNDSPNGQFSLFPTDTRNFAPVMQRRDPLHMYTQGNWHLPEQTVNSHGVLSNQATAGTLPVTTEEDDEFERRSASGKNKSVKLAPLEIFKHH